MGKHLHLRILGRAKKMCLVNIYDYMKRTFFYSLLELWCVVLDFGGLGLNEESLLERCNSQVQGLIRATNTN